MAWFKRVQDVAIRILTVWQVKPRTTIHCRENASLKPPVVWIPSWGNSRVRLLSRLRLLRCKRNPIKQQQTKLSVSHISPRQLHLQERFFNPSVHRRRWPRNWRTCSFARSLKLSKRYFKDSLAFEWIGNPRKCWFPRCLVSLAQSSRLISYLDGHLIQMDHRSFHYFC